jgi:hypothetical protein
MWYFSIRVVRVPDKINLWGIPPIVEFIQVVYYLEYIYHVTQPLIARSRMRQ